jgi:hypothetical protein
MQIVAISSHVPTQSYYMYQEFLASCRRFGYEPIILSEGYGGLGTKPKMLKRAIESGIVKDKYIIFCDAWDILFQRDPTVLDKSNDDCLVFNAEKKCFPNPKLAEKFPESRTSYRYLNSGFSTGSTNAYLKALKEMKADEIPADTRLPDGSWNNPNDQEYWQKEYLFGTTEIYLDKMCDYCQTLSDVTEDELDFSSPLIRNKETWTTPFCFHVNGRKEEWKPKLVAHLGL